jgi:hypothetical protein
MMSNNSYLNLAEFNNQSEITKTIIDPRRRFPEMIFSSTMTHFYFYEFDLMTTPDFMFTLRKLAEHFKDDAIVVAVLDPDPVQYFLREFGHCGAFRVSSEATDDTYFALLAHEPPESPADALLYNSSIITWTTNGRHWAIWGERDTGIGVLGASDDLEFLPSIRGRIPLSLAAEFATSNLRLSINEAMYFKDVLLRNFSERG